MLQQHDEWLCNHIAKYGLASSKAAPEEWFAELHAIGLESKIVSPFTSSDTFRSLVRRTMAKKAPEEISVVSNDDRIEADTTCECSTCAQT